MDASDLDPMDSIDLDEIEEAEAKEEILGLDGAG